MQTVTMINLMVQAKKLGESLRQQGLILVLAESCTAGGVAYAVTSVPGSSTYFDRGFVTYSNQAKQEMLGVSPDLLARHGAVSEEVAIAMAEGALKFSSATVALAITGIAGPDGGTIDRPVGCVWFGLVAQNKPKQSICQHFLGDRQSIREQGIEFSLKALLEYTHCN